MHPCWFRPVLSLVLLAALQLPALPCRAYTYLQVGVDSNFLVDEQRAIFAQADGSLTVLSLDSGHVLIRDRSRNYSGTFLRVSRGILVYNSDSVALLDPVTFNTAWEAASHHDPIPVGGDLLTHDENGLIQCRDLRDGHIRWSCVLPGVLEITADSGRVLVHRAATYEEEKAPTTMLLDMESGRELFRRIPPRGFQWPGAFLSGTNVYVVVASYKERRSECEPERLVTWNLRGNEIASVPIPTELRPLARDGKVFDLDQKAFWKGHVYPDRRAIQPEVPMKPIDTRESANGSLKIFESEYDLGDDVRFLERAKYTVGTNSEDVAFAMEVEYRSPKHQWTGILPYLVNRGRISAVAKAEDKILIGTDLGQVECVKADTGESQWLYVFPTVRRTVSSSRKGLPPTLAEAAAVFRRENGTLPTSGLQVLNGKASKPPVVRDPNPIDPYRELPVLLAMAWGGAAVPFAIVVLIHLLPRTRRWGSGVLGSIAAWLIFVLFCGYLFYGQVSPMSRLAFQIAAGTSFVLGLIDTFISLRRSHRVEAAILATTLAGIALFVILALL